MNTISDLFRPRLFEGQYRIISVRSLHSRTSQKFLQLKLEDSSGFITAYAWDGQYDGSWEFSSMDVIQAKGRTRFYQDKWVADVRKALIPSTLSIPSTTLLPFSHTPAQHLLPQLVQIESQIKHPALKTFVASVFTDMSIAIPFLSVPGSLKHHHNEAGGLLRHSIECAQIAAAIPMLNDDHRDMAIIGALLHDIGKIWVFNDMRRTNLGHLVDHQALTLEVFALQLQKLTTAWPDAALALRHILTCRSIKRWGYEPRMAIASVVQMADKISVEMDMEKRSFADVRAIRNVSNRITNQATTFWRPSAPSVSENSQQM